jgi:hypothetical protein
VSVNPKPAAFDANLRQRFLAFIVIVKSLKHNQTNSMGDFCCPPFSLSRCGVLRQGFDKFYSVSFQARRSLVCHFQEFLARLKAYLVTNFSFPPWLSLPPPLLEEAGEHQKISILLLNSCIADSYLLLYKNNAFALFSSILLCQRFRFTDKQ